MQFKLGDKRFLLSRLIFQMCSTLVDDLRAAINAKEAAKKRFQNEYQTEIMQLPCDMPFTLKLSCLFGDTVRWNGSLCSIVEGKRLSNTEYKLLFDLFDE